MSRFTRRSFLVVAGLGSAAGLVAACAGPAPAPAATTAPAAGSQPAAQATTAPAAKPAAAKGDVSLRILCRAGVFGNHTREFAKRYATETGFKVETEDAEWNDLPKKIETQFVSGDPTDVMVCDTAYYPYLVSKGAFMMLDDLVKASPPPDFEDYPDLAFMKRWADGKLGGLTGDAGINDIVTWYNKDMLQKLGLKEPTDDWTMEDYVSLMDQAVSKDKTIFGGASSNGISHTGDGWLRNWGRWILDPEGKKIELTHEKTKTAIKWYVDVTKRKLYPNRQDTQGTDTIALFAAGKMLTVTSNPGAYGGLDTAVGTKFQYGTVLAPKGPSSFENPPRRAFIPYANRHMESSKSKFPPEAFGLLARTTSYECMKWSTLNTGKQPGNLKAWRDPEVLKIRPIFGKVADLMAKCTDVFPIPANTRYVEMRDVGNELFLPIEYAEAAYTDDAIASIEKKVQAIVDQPKP